MKKEQIQINWNEVEIDTPLLVKDNNMEEWREAYFAEFIDGCVYTFPNGLNSHSYKGILVMGWDEAKIADTSFSKE